MQPYGATRRYEICGLAALPIEQLFPAFVDEVCRFSSRQDFEDDVCIVAVERAFCLLGQDRLSWRFVPSGLAPDSTAGSSRP